MKDDLNDIDLIDKYLEGELNEAQEKQFKERYLADDEFKREVEVYRKIYEGIHEAAKENLQQRLNGYYDEYLQEELLIDDNENNNNIRSINWKKAAYIISSIAASVCLFAVAFWYFNKGDAEINQQASTMQHDQPPAKKAPGADHVSQRSNQVKGSYALTSQLRLPDTSIRKAIYPQQLKYTFNNGLITIYGDPLLGLIHLNIFKKDNRYILSYQDTAYKLAETNKLNVLEAEPRSVQGGNIKSAESLQVQIAPVQTTVYASAPIGVVISPGKGSPGYYFTREKSKIILVLNGDFDPYNLKVVKLNGKNQEDTWYIIAGGNVYMTNKYPENPVPLKLLSGLADSAARMFIKRAPVAKNIFVFNR